MIISISLSFVLVTLSLLLGWFLKIHILNESIIIVLLSISLFILLIFIIINIILKIKFNKRYSNKNFRIIMEDFFNKSDNDYFTYDKSYKILKNIIKYFYIYIIFIIVLNCLVSSFIFYFSLNKKDSSIIPYVLIIYYVITGLLFILIGYPKNQFGYYLNPNTFKEIYNILEEVKNNLNYHKNINLYIYEDNNLIMSYYKGSYQLSIGIYNILFFTKDELKASFYHELGHVIYNDSYQLSKRVRLMDNINFNIHNSSVFALSSLFTFGISNYLILNFNIHDQIISKTLENRADDVVLKYNMNEEFISTAIKMNYFNYYTNLLEKRFDSFENEDMSLHFYEDVIYEVFDNLDKYKERFNYYILHEYESKNQSHPCLRNRMKKMNIDSFDYHSLERYNNYEINKILEVFQNVTKENEENYKIRRENTYLKNLEIVNDFEKNIYEDVYNLALYMNSLLELKRVEDAYSISNKIIELYPNNSQAYYFRSLIKFRYYDDASGIEDFLKSCTLNKNFINYFDEAFDFCKKMGLKDEIDYLKKEYINFTQDYIDVDYDNLSYIDNKTIIEDYKLDNEIKDKIIEIAKKHNFVRVYCVLKKIKKDDVRIVLIVPDKDSIEPDFGMNDIFKILDVREEQFALTYLFNKHLEKRIKKISNPFYERINE